LHGLPIAKIDRRTIAALLRDLAESNGPYASDNCRAALSSFFAWALKNGAAIDANPVAFTNKQGDLKPRSRVLDDQELVEIWQALEDNDYGAIVRLLILTGQRREEIGSLRWDEVVDGKIVLPAERTKNGREHEIHLAPAALAILRDRIRRIDKVHVFGAAARSGFGNWGQSKARLDARVLQARREKDPKAKRMPMWRVHDLRRSAATHMNTIGVAPHIVEVVLNHHSGTRGGIAGVYNKSRYSTEARELMERWSAHVMSIVQGERRILRA
jgi:integrase